MFEYDSRVTANNHRCARTRLCTCLHTKMVPMSDDQVREDWPIGPALRRARERAGLSVRAAARRTNGAVSSGRWYQLESGWQKNKGVFIPVGTTAASIAAAARAVQWDVDEALTIAGFDPAMAIPAQAGYARFSDEELMEEFAALSDEVRRRMEGRSFPHGDTYNPKAPPL